MSEENKFDIKKWFSGFVSTVSWSKEIKTLISVGLIALFAYMIWFTFFRKTPQNVSNQRVVVTPFAKVDKIDQSSIQVMVEEKTWEMGVGVGAVSYDNKSGAMAGVWVKKKW